VDVKSIPYNALPVTDPRLQAAGNAAAGQAGAAGSTGQAGGQNSAKIKKVSREFEAMFVNMMLKSMRETVGKDKLTGGGKGEETFRSMLDQEYADQAARTGTIGLARAVERELTRRKQPVPSVLPAAQKEGQHAD